MSDFGETSRPTARKNYRCAWCGQEIPKGKRHAHYVGKWQGEFQDWRMHDECYDNYDPQEYPDGFSLYEGERPQQEAAK